MCKHDDGCNHPEGECSGACMTQQTSSETLDSITERIAKHASPGMELVVLSFAQTFMADPVAVRVVAPDGRVFLHDYKGQDITHWATMNHSAKLLYTEPLSAAQGVPEGWQPIETAPKDGTVIIALQCWIYHTDAARRPHYVLHEVFFNDDGGWEVVEDGEILDEDSLTHWLPRTRLPAAPEQAEGKEGKE